MSTPSGPSKAFWKAWATYYEARCAKEEKFGIYGEASPTEDEARVAWCEAGPLLGGSIRSYFERVWANKVRLAYDDAKCTKDEAVAAYVAAERAKGAQQ